MNNERRKKIAEAVEQINAAIGNIENAKAILDECKDEELDAFDNLPEGLQSSERGERMEENIGYLEAAISELDNIE